VHHRIHQPRITQQLAWPATGARVTPRTTAHLLLLLLLLLLQWLRRGAS
jgi:hypothetical protein